MLQCSWVEIEMDRSEQLRRPNPELARADFAKVEQSQVISGIQPERSIVLYGRMFDPAPPDCPLKWRPGQPKMGCRTCTGCLSASSKQRCLSAGFCDKVWGSPGLCIYDCHRSPDNILQLTTAAFTMYQGGAFDTFLSGGLGIWVDSAANQIKCHRHRELNIGFPGRGHNYRADHT